ncbi:MAG: NUDIX domain-containing protein [gamma proteobacterium symbiont of Bathyaustriella thionipta]|nr:NUDIX domain-containing protein [gamma proteobacterium symbiont of Bathyaustriella thionipta]MCU7949535.1 NUDIX domain-containing protein [gamma proteobacterium symbiont of Bathyaustriella thionipta]MCU7954249.1 NUDIX domain-containing protein [gamma proteobacterium symbiont of Bathyaustriella thionipta]MCU7956135.1 NUDIX domain-containing protein [gamma proteobacterium symbiont of Bathyaustriella thionipta]MCU7968736.1 NUDIX domain-containing protein [gamma proteobacterium symbiont of Bathy
MKKLNYQDVNIIQKKTGHNGFFVTNQYTLQHTLFSGGQTRELTRECFERGHAVGVIAYDPWQDNIVLLEQFRIGAYIHINEQLTNEPKQLQSPWLLEIIAGIVEPGESQIAVAHREAEEEAGLKLLALESIGNFYSSPGGSSETTHLYCACVNSAGAGGIHGLEEEGEDIQVRVVSFAEAVQLLEEGELNNASAMIAMQWLMLHRDELRARWQYLE